jgi:hypothetical protein
MDLPALSPTTAATILWGAAVWLALGLAVVGVWSLGNRARVGAPEHCVRRRFGVRVALVAGYVLVAAIALAVPSEIPRLPLALELALGLVLLAASPGFQDSKVGASGVQRGWHARRWAELEEWRLTGDHLRWKLDGTWVASDLPAARHAAVRERLLAAAGDRESRFVD